MSGLKGGVTLCETSLTPILAGELLTAAARDFGARPALNFFGREWTYSQLARQVARMACGLQAYGVAKGTRVALLLPNTPYSVMAYYAVLQAGGVVVNLNPLYAERELAHQLTDSGAELVITVDLRAITDRLSSALALGGNHIRHIVICPFAKVLPFPRNLLFPWVKRAQIARRPYDKRAVALSVLMGKGHAPRPVSLDPVRDAAVLQYTGGTTGLPKAATLTHANITVNTAQCAAWFEGCRPGQERILGVLPLFHVFAMTVVMNLGVKLGAQIILLPRFDLRETVETIHRLRPTMFPAVPSIYAAINVFRGLAEYDLSSIRLCISGGAGLPGEVKRRFEQLTGCVLVEGYGLTETAPVAACNPVRESGKIGSIGLALPGTVIEIVDMEDGISVLPTGEKGEICIRGPQVMAGYWNQPDETKRVLIQTPQGTRLRTGDVGYQDEQGYTFLVDRIKDLALIGGYNVYPRQVEEAIYRHPDVAECAVAGLPDALRGQQLKAWVVLRPGASLGRDALHDFLQSALAPWEVPRFIEFRDALPKTLIGKISRKDLVEAELAARADKTKHNKEEKAA